MQYNKWRWKNVIFFVGKETFFFIFFFIDCRKKTLNQVTLKMLKQNTLNSYTSSIIYFKSAQNYIWQMIYKNKVIFIIQFFQTLKQKKTSTLLRKYQE